MVNLAYQWNGRSVLAGDPSTQVAADLPDRIAFGLGFDTRINDRLTLAFDLLSERVLDSPQLELTPFTASGELGSRVFQDLSFRSESYFINNGSAGMKFALHDGLLANVNLRFTVGGEGLSDRLTPMIGIEYAF